MRDDKFSGSAALADHTVMLMGECDGWEPARPVPECFENELHVWRASLEVGADRCSAFERLLDGPERRRASRFRFARDREAFVASHGILRSILGRYEHRRPETLRFHYTVSGKPFIHSSEPGGVYQFNMSHTRNLVAVVVARGRDVGIDVEQIRVDVTADDLSPLIRFAADLYVGDPDTITAGDARLFRLWARTEAILKASGTGLSADGLSFRSIESRRGARGSSGAACWQLWDFSPRAGCAGAVAVASAEGELRVRLFDYGVFQAYEGL
ncbi:MAG: 4'-phosphopantetheinyl transferase superfamily protein [Bacteroidota bacterium]